MKPEEEDEDDDHLASVEWKSKIQLMGMRGVGKKNNTAANAIIIIAKRYPDFDEYEKKLKFDLMAAGSQVNKFSVRSYKFCKEERQFPRTLLRLEELLEQEDREYAMRVKEKGRIFDVKDRDEYMEEKRVEYEMNIWRTALK